MSASLLNLQDSSLETYRTDFPRPDLAESLLGLVGWSHPWGADHPRGKQGRRHDARVRLDCSAFPAAAWDVVWG